MGIKKRVDEAKKAYADSPAAVELKAKLRESAVKAGLKAEDIDRFMETALPQMMEIIDKVVTVETIGMFCTVALITKGYRPYYGNHAGKSGVALMTDPHAGFTHKMSTAILMELDNWFQKSTDDTIRSEAQAASTTGGSAKPS